MEDEADGQNESGPDAGPLGDRPVSDDPEVSAAAGNDDVATATGPRTGAKTGPGTGAPDVDRSWDPGEDAIDQSTVEELFTSATNADTWSEEDSAYRPGEPFLWSMSGAGLYSVSFGAVVAGFSLTGAPGAVDTYVRFLSEAVALFSIPLMMFVGLGLGFETLGAYERSSRQTIVTPSLFATTMILPVVMHVVQFFFEVVGPGYTGGALSEFAASSPAIAQLYIWPPVLVCTVFAFVVYRYMGERGV